MHYTNPRTHSQLYDEDYMVYHDGENELRRVRLSILTVINSHCDAEPPASSLALSTDAQ